MSDFKVRCKQSNVKYFTEGEIYDVADGRLQTNVGFLRGYWTKDVDSINTHFCSNVKFELVTEPQQFTKDMLKTGMRMEDREGDIYTVYLGTEKGDIIQGKYWGYLESYNNDFTHSTGNRLDIVKVYAMHMEINLSEPLKHGKLLWQRPEPRKINKAEAEKLLSEHLEEQIQIEG